LTTPTLTPTAGRQMTASPRIEAAVAELAAALTEAIVTQRPAPGVAPKLLDIPSACAALGGVSRAQFYKIIATGNGPRTIKIGRRRMVVAAWRISSECHGEGRGTVPRGLRWTR